MKISHAKFVTALRTLPRYEILPNGDMKVLNFVEAPGMNHLYIIKNSGGKPVPREPSSLFYESNHPRKTMIKTFIDVCRSTLPDTAPVIGNENIRMHHKDGSIYVSGSMEARLQIQLQGLGAKFVEKMKRISGVQGYGWMLPNTFENDVRILLRDHLPQKEHTAADPASTSSTSLSLNAQSIQEQHAAAELASLSSSAPPAAGAVSTSSAHSVPPVVAPLSSSEKAPEKRVRGKRALGGGITMPAVGAAVVPKADVADSAQSKRKRSK